MNITVDEIVIFFGTMLHISIDPHIMGVYPSSFVEDPMIHLGNIYYVQLRSYDAWEKYIATLIIFKQICSSFHTEA